MHDIIRHLRSCVSTLTGRMRSTTRPTGADERSGLVDVYCGDCGVDRSADLTLTNAKRTPCAECGHSVLSYKRHLVATATASANFSSSLTPGTQERDWQLRWKQLQQRLPRVTGPRSEPRSGDAIHSAAQDLFEFFVSGYHLKDALIADGAVAKVDVEGAINASPILGLLADLANLDKHRRLDVKKHPPRSGDVPVVERISDTSSGSTWQLLVEIRHMGTKVDGVAFAAVVVSEWRIHLLRWGLGA
ncbi:MAG: hypothetical protein M3N98_08855 [Actinomycetota bacterium]|nr:hypothetical protein [Actinomycetota bacterium]